MPRCLAIFNQLSLPLSIQWHSQTGDLVDSYAIPAFGRLDRDCSSLVGEHSATIAIQDKEYRHAFDPAQGGDWYLDESGIKELLIKSVPDLVIDKEQKMLVIPLNNPIIQALIQGFQQGKAPSGLAPSMFGPAAV
jgi:hypothetical protein